MESQELILRLYAKSVAAFCIAGREGEIVEELNLILWESEEIADLRCTVPQGGRSV